TGGPAAIIQRHAVAGADGCARRPAGVVASGGFEHRFGFSGGRRGTGHHRDAGASGRLLSQAIRAAPHPAVGPVGPPPLLDPVQGPDFPVASRTAHAGSFEPLHWLNEARSGNVNERLMIPSSTCRAAAEWSS